MKRGGPEGVLSLNRKKPLEFASVADFENLVISFSASYQNCSVISMQKNSWHSL